MIEITRRKLFFSALAAGAVAAGSKLPIGFPEQGVRMTTIIADEHWFRMLFEEANFAQKALLFPEWWQVEREKLS